MPFLTSQRGRSFRTVCFGRNKRNSPQKNPLSTLRLVVACGSFVMVWICSLHLMPVCMPACVMVHQIFFLFQTRELGWLTAGGLSLSRVGVLVDSFVSRNEESTFGSSC